MKNADDNTDQGTSVPVVAGVVDAVKTYPAPFVVVAVVLATVIGVTLFAK